MTVQEAVMHHRHHEDFGEDLREQLTSLSHEVAALRKQIMRRGRSTYRDTRHMGGDALEVLSDYLQSALPEIRRGAYQVQEQARQHPGATAAAAAVGVIVLGLAASMLLRR
jgi:hypothetical protein